MKKNEEKIENVINLINLVILIAASIFIAYVGVCAAHGQTVWQEVKRDTIFSDQIKVIEYEKRDGTLALKCTWCGKSVASTQKDLNSIMEGDDRAVIIVTYNVDGFLICEPKKVIAVNMRRSEGRGL